MVRDQTSSQEPAGVSSPPPYRLKVKEVREVGKGSIAITFSLPDPGFSYEAGQYLNLKLKIRDDEVLRPYSFCSTPGIDPDPTIAVKSVAGGLVSNYLVESARPGMDLEAYPPTGKFTTQYHKDNKRSLIFWGGGSGITPLFSILRSVLEIEHESRVTLVYFNRSAEYIIFNEDLKKLDISHPQFRVIHILEDDPKKMAHFRGVATQELLGQIMEGLDSQKNQEHYICGPQGMIDQVTRKLEATGTPAGSIRVESFDPAPPDPPGNSESSGETCSANLILLGVDNPMILSKDAPILAQGLAKGYQIPHSCQKGICTTCLARCLEGTVSTEGMESLSKEELTEGYVLTCVGYPLSDTLVLEFE